MESFFVSSSLTNIYNLSSNNRSENVKKQIRHLLKWLTGSCRLAMNINRKRLTYIVDYINYVHSSEGEYAEF